MSNYIRHSEESGNHEIAIVGGKNASLCEMLRHLSSEGVRVPNLFVVTAAAYRYFIEYNSLSERLGEALNQLNIGSLENLHEVGETCRNLIRQSEMPEDLSIEIVENYKRRNGDTASVAVRSSATAEDLPTASFAGQHESFLNVTGGDNLVTAVKRCYVSLFNDRAIKYRLDNGFESSRVALAVGVQSMVRSDKACAGVAFTVEPETGSPNLIYLTSSWGLCENLVQGAVNPDEYYIFKPALEGRHRSIVYRHLGKKEMMMIYDEKASPKLPVINVPTPERLQQQWTLTDGEAEALARWCVVIEKHYQMPMDVEWAKDGLTNEFFIVQARPVTVNSKQDRLVIKEYTLQKAGEVLCTGKAVGQSIVSGRVCIVQSLDDAGKVQQGDIIVAEITNPDWNALLRKAVCIVTDKGGRTSHASIVARELGISAVVGTLDATATLKDGRMITVSCAEGDVGKVYDGVIEWELKERVIAELEKTRTQAMFILADPDRALQLSLYPNSGVGLLRMEFVISNHIRVHPMALCTFDELPESPDKTEIESLTREFADKKEYFVQRLSEAIAMVAASFYPKDVIVRTSDFKTNEYAQLIGGEQFEPKEENPMLGFRGASRYYSPRYRQAFGLECKAIKCVREEMGLTNVKVMIPFCRTVTEGKKVLEVMKDFGLTRGQAGLEVYVMAEIPSNVILAKEFAEIFDGFSIGSNDLTQLTLGIDRDSSIVSDIFDENNEAVKELLKQVIQSAHHSGRKIGLCGQAPSDLPAFAEFLVHQKIDSISFNADAMLRGIENIIVAEKNHF